MEKYGKNLKKCRQNANFSIDDVSKKFNVNPQIINDWENDISQPNPIELYALAELYKVEVEDFKETEVEVVDIDADGVHVSTKTSRFKRDSKSDKFWRKMELISSNFTFIIILTIYIILGCVLPDGTGWRNYWVLFFLVPVIPSLFGAIRKKNANLFCIPMLILGIYLGIGMIGNIWHPTWAIFLIIPVYYSFVKIFENKE